MPRLRTLCAVACVAACLFAWLPSVGASAADAPRLAPNWSQGEFDAAHTAYNTREQVLSPQNVGRLTLAWSVPIPGGIWASPIVSDGRVFLGDGEGAMHAFDAATGRELWSNSAEPGAFFVDSAASHDGLVYASAIYRPLRTYDAATGRLGWSADRCPSVRASPTGADDVLYLACFTGSLVALQPRTGRVIWKVAGGCCVYDQAPVVDRGRVFQMRTNDTLTAYDTASGAVLWRQSEFSIGTMASAGGTLFFNHYPDVVAVDEATGQELWRAPVGSGGSGSPAVADGMVFVVSSQLYALNARTGDVVWSAPAASTWGPTVANGVVYASSLSGEWDAFDERDGSLLWSVTSGSGCGGTCAEGIPVVSNGMLYLPGPDQYLRAYRLGP